MLNLVKKTLSLLALGVGMAACSGGSIDNLNSTGANLVGVQCTWPTDLNDAGSGACSASRTYVACSDPAGDKCLCASDGPQSCDCSGFVSGGPWTCKYACAPNQYFVSCGSIGPSAGSPADPPTGCTSLGANPGGTVSYCCPCQ